MRMKTLARAGAVLLALSCPALAQQPTPKPPSVGPAFPDLGLKVEVEQKAIDLLKAASARLAAAKTVQFDAIATYESPARTGETLAYATLSHVTLQRPDKLRVITPGDGPPSEFYFDGRTVIAYAPEENLAAIADAPGTVDQMLAQAYKRAAIYFPFTDLIVSDPYKAIADDIKLAFVVGKSHVIGGVETDIIVIANDDIQAQIWLGAEDHLPRMVRATYFNDPAAYRHLVAYSNWVLDGKVEDGAFTSSKASGAHLMQFAPPMPEKPATQATPGSKTP